MIDLENIETLARAATPGQWVFAPMTEKDDPEIAAANGSRVATLGAADITKANSAYIAAANPAAVLELIEKLRVALAAAPVQAQEQRFKEVGSFLYIGVEYVATSGDDPRGIKLYRPMVAPVQPVALPDGWKLVPVQLTPTMLDVSDAGERTTKKVWRDMLAVAPAAPAAQGDAKELTDKEIVQAVRSVGVDTHPSKFGFNEEQIEGMSVTVLRQVIAAIAAKAVKS